MENEFKAFGNKLSLIAFYKDQLKKFFKLGIGKKTEFNVVVTDTLINITKKRMAQLVNDRTKSFKSTRYKPKYVEDFTNE